MEKEFVPYELAFKLVYDLGFKEKCLATIDQVNDLHIKGTKSLPRGAMLYDIVDCPTFSQAFRWFREKNFHVNIDSYHCLGKAKPFGLSIDYLHESGKWDYVDYRDDADFETYEEAQKRAIEVIIEIISQTK